LIGESARTTSAAVGDCASYKPAGAKNSTGMPLARASTTEPTTEFPMSPPPPAIAAMIAALLVIGVILTSRFASLK
jgi:hypothetical protein